MITIVGPNGQSEVPQTAIQTGKNPTVGHTATGGQGAQVYEAIKPFVTIAALGVVVWLAVALLRGSPEDKTLGVFILALALVYLGDPVVQTQFATVQSTASSLLKGGNGHG